MSNRFDVYFREWINSACLEWGYQIPTEKYFDKVYKRLPAGVRTILAEGVEKGIILSDGHKFSLKGLGENKGPYNWFSKYSKKQEPGLNWEYFVQVALYSQLYCPSRDRGLKLNFEDELMDITLYDKDKLVVCIEVKEKSNQIKKLITDMKKYQDEVDMEINDRGNDPLRKAKYLIQKKPQYFCGYAIGDRYDFSVVYNGNSFRLEKDIIPMIL